MASSTTRTHLHISYPPSATTTPRVEISSTASAFKPIAAKPKEKSWSKLKEKVEAGERNCKTNKTSTNLLEWKQAIAEAEAYIGAELKSTTSTLSPMSLIHRQAFIELQNKSYTAAAPTPTVNVCKVIMTEQKTDRIHDTDSKTSEADQIARGIDEVADPANSFPKKLGKVGHKLAMDSRPESSSASSPTCFQRLCCWSKPQPLRNLNNIDSRAKPKLAFT